MRKLSAILLLLIILGSGIAPRAATQGKLNQHPTLDGLESEAQAIRKTRPEQWKQWTEEAEKFYEDFAKKTFPWRSRGLAPLPDFKSFNFPLAFLAAQLRQLHAANERDAHFRFRGYLEAVVAHADPRRARFLEEFGALDGGKLSRDETVWDRLLARAADASWATEKLREKLVGDLRLYESALAYMLLERFAEELPPDVVAAGYGYVYAQGQQGGIYVINENEVEHWKLLLRLDPARALSDINALHENKPPAAPLLSLLIERVTAPHERIAKAASEWLSDVYRPGAQFKNVPLHVLMLKSAPDAHLPTVVGRVNKLVGVSRPYDSDDPAWPDESETLIAAMLEIEPAHIKNAHTRAMHATALATYAVARAVGADLRLNILKWMAQQSHPELPKVIARRLAEEPDAKERERLRQHAQTLWGAYGREALQQAEQIKAEKKPKP